MKLCSRCAATASANANTIASELKRLENGRSHGTNNTVLIVDEAAMVATEHLAELAAAARQSGAKLILAGDDKQLGSIERGGMFETLRQTHGAAILKDVQRVKDAEQKRAFGKMHEGEFLGALADLRQGGRHPLDRRSRPTPCATWPQAYTADVAADARQAPLYVRLHQCRG